MSDGDACGCGEPDTLGTGATTCLFLETGYPWCRACGEHHRPPECPIDEQGRALAPCGHPWADTALPGHYDDQGACA